ncbi:MULTISPECIES: c-type cytochrome [unclassified Leptolyngbya]|uniref:c-type cytochrome n=1 Tax=unclassified Leptolyngbya TaxID=2650499 RepID=UPI0016873E0B|nr:MULTISPECIES: c-type cytochrome [unclassified Leptolyngbya]MBD1913001.1 c-type cytochrome [Leptolyngbya sp. FACHB-8]MBD2152929.1 c-type cytochrome [Leptolyngbya sp. FACHB-16]
MRRLVTGLIVAMFWLGAIAGTWAAELPTSNLPDAAPLFETHCAGCHINGGNIIRRGKNLKQKTLERNGYDTAEAIAQLVTHGKGNMPAYADRMTPDEIQAVANYVLEQAAQNWKP